MVEATFVVYAPKAQLAKVRGLVRSQTPEAVTWRERRTLFGSEFYVTGPSSLAREAHEAAARLLSWADRPG
jgi:hypothetical protein